jgi:hypothetical protein
MVKGMLSFGADAMGVWPLEDASTSTILSNRVAGGAPGGFSDVTLGDAERPAGSARSVKLGTTGHMYGAFLTSTASGWQISFAFRLAALPGSATYEEIFTWYDSTGRRWTWELNNANHGWTVYAADGTVLASLATSYSAAPPNQWIRIKMKATVAGATVTYEPSWYPEGSNAEVGVTATFAGTATGYLTRWDIRAATYNVGAWYTGVFGIDDATAPLFNIGVIQDFNGHAGETAGDRFARLMGDLGLAYTVLGDPALSAPMGGQPEATFADLCKEIVATDDALMFDDIDAVALVLMLRNARYNQTPALALTVTDLPFRPKEVTDDQTTHNVVTASQRDGGQYTATDATGPRGTQPPPAGVGEAKQTVDVNVADETLGLRRQAYWWLNRGTVNLPRYPQVTIDLNAQPGLVTAVNTVDVGSVITIAGYRENLIRLYVLGWTETIGTHTRTITFTCAPDQQFVVGVYDASASRYDSASSIVVNRPAAGGTFVKIGTGDPTETWHLTATPYDLMISGERMTVTAMGAAGTGTQLVSGTFESGTTGWSGSSGTFAQSSTFAHSGTFSGLLTVTGTPTSALARVDTTSCPAVVPGASYTLSVWVQSVVNLPDVRARIEWLDANFANIGSVDAGGALVSGSWVQRITATVQAPAGARYVRYGATISSSPATGTLLYIDDVSITSPTASFQDATVTRAVNGVAKALPAGAEVHVATPGRYAL